MLHSLHRPSKRVQCLKSMAHMEKSAQGGCSICLSESVFPVSYYLRNRKTDSRVIWRINLDAKRLITRNDSQGLRCLLRVQNIPTCFPSRFWSSKLETAVCKFKGIVNRVSSRLHERLAISMAARPHADISVYTFKPTKLYKSLSKLLRTHP